AADERDELAPFHLRAHSITSSVRPSSASGNVMPIALVAFRLTYSSTFVACWTGGAGGLSTFENPPALFKYIPTDAAHPGARQKDKFLQTLPQVICTYFLPDALCSVRNHLHIS